MSQEVHVSVWKKDGLDENQLMGFSSPSYPNYQKGDTLYLEKDIAPGTPENIAKNNKPLRLTKFVITDVIHSVRQWFYPNSPTVDNPFPFKISDNLSLDVYVEEFPEEE